MLNNRNISLDPISFRFPSDAEWLFLVTFITSFLFCFFFIPQENTSTFLFYGAALIISVFLVFVSDLCESKQFALFLFVISLLIFAFPMAFRNLTGIDDSVYEHAYLFISDGRFQEVASRFEMEKGYIFLNFVISRIIGPDYYIAQSVICYLSFVFWGIALWMYRGKCNLSMMLLLLWSNYYFFVMYAGLIRIFIALPIALIAFNMIANKKVRTFIFLLLFASVFHRSALILVLLFPLFYDSVLNQWMKFVGLIFFIIPVVFIIIAKVLVPILGSRYAGYGEIGAFSISVGKFDMLPLLGLGAYFYQFVEEKYRKEFVVGLVLISLSIIFSIWSSLVALGRLIFYANLGVLIVASNIFKQRPIGIAELFAPCIFVMYSFFYVMHCSFLNPVSVEYLFPYSSYLFK